MPHKPKPGGPRNPANLNFFGLNVAQNLQATDVLVVSQPGFPNRRTTVGGVAAFGVVPDPLLLGDGSAAAPSYSFASDPDNGIFLVAANKLGISVNATLQWLFDTNVFESNSSFGAQLQRAGGSETDPVHTFTNDNTTGMGRAGAAQLSLIAGGIETIRITPEQFLAIDGAVDEPIYSFASDPGTGMFSDGASGILFSLDGTLRWSLLDNEFTAQIANGPQIRNIAASATVPTLNPNSTDANTGIGSGGADQLSLVAGGLDCINVAETAAARQIGFYVTAPISLQTGVPVTAAGIHAALVNLGLITA